jgi:hypothetical protein
MPVRCGSDDMSMLNLQVGYFSVESPWRLLDRWLNRYRYRQTALLDGREIEVRWTRRAEHALRVSPQSLIVELQLYFSCVVKKRVVFHQHADFVTTRVDDRLEIAFRPIASRACDPREFALHYPAGKDLSAGPARRMIPRIVEIDFRRGRWDGQFGYC